MFSHRVRGCLTLGLSVLFEGILVFYYREIRDMFNMKLFVDTDPDTRLSRRGKLSLSPDAICFQFLLFSWQLLVLRDVQERGRDLEFVLCQYTNFVKPAFEEFCLPTKKVSIDGSSCVFY